MSDKRCIAFIDAAGLHRAASAAFGSCFPEFHPQSLAKAICELKDWDLVETRLYVISPTEAQDRKWFNFWRRKSNFHRSEGVTVLKSFYHESPHLFPVYDSNRHLVNYEVRPAFGNSSVSVRMALDLVNKYYDDEFDVALLFSREASLIQAINDIKIDSDKDDDILFASAIPYESGDRGYCGINGTDWIHFGKDLYNSCLDKNDYRSNIFDTQESL